MPEFLSIPHPTGAAAVALAMAGVAWLVAVTVLLRRGRPGEGAWGFRTGARRTRRPALGATRPGSDAIRPDTGPRRPGPARPPRSSDRRALPAVPPQGQAGPHREAVDLTPAERAAFEGLVRRISGDR
ncbi:hypothetical protein AB0N31_06590 [Streptomyces sp. NPDC051051]|uniref:hypothetical protein n=1 Tax=Streptomyces sp. NPDC051051 TaxID=3155666 RepID=UPI00344055F7